jgi:uncharacterized integral membrane protein (TIGR00698 family)
MIKRINELLPGLVVVILVAAGAAFVHGLVPKAAQQSLGEVIFAVLIGLLVGNLLQLPSSTKPGIRFSFQNLLRLAIILLGARLSLVEVAKIGGKALLMIVLLMTLALVVAHLLGRLLGVPPKLASLIGVGTSVCGNSAISATAPVIGAKDDEVSFAIAANTLLGTLAVFTYPLLGRAFGFDDATYGTWVGTAVNDTSQVVAAGFALSERSGEIATTVKLTRNALMGAVIVLMGFLHAAPERKNSSFAQKLKQSVPLFVVLFLGMALLRTFGVLDSLGAALGLDLIKLCGSASKWLILAALAGVGLSTQASTLRKTGLKPFYVGLVVAVLGSVTSLLLIRLLGPAG